MAQYTSEKNHTYRALVMDNADIVSFGTVSGTSGSVQTTGVSTINGQFAPGNTLAYYVLPCSMKFYGAAIYCNVASGTHKVTGMNVVVGTGAYVAAATQTQDNVDVSGFPPTYAPTGSALFMGTGTTGPQDLLTTGTPVASGIYYTPAGPTSGVVATINQFAVGGSSRVIEKKHLRIGSSVCCSNAWIVALANTAGPEPSKFASTAYQYMMPTRCSGVKSSGRNSSHGKSDGL